MSTGPRIATVDLETAPLHGYFWDLRDQNIGLEMITDEWSILSYCWKWLNSAELIYEDTGGKGRRQVRNDKKIVRNLWSLVDQADIVIAQNGKKFDVKKMNARMVMHGMLPYSPIRVIDTYLVCKEKFGFTSNRLAWTSKHLTDVPKDEHREFPGFDLWKACLEDDPKAFAEMKKYNCRDVVATEQKYLVLRPWISRHPNLAAYSFGDGVKCPRCESTKLQHRGRETTQHGSYARIKCQSCGGWSRLKQNLIGKEDRARLLVN